MILDVDIQEGSHKTFSGQPAGCSDLLQAQSSILLRMQEYRIPSFCQRGARLVIHTNVPLRIDHEKTKGFLERTQFKNVGNVQNTTTDLMTRILTH